MAIYGITVTVHLTRMPEEAPEIADICATPGIHLGRFGATAP